MSKAAAAVAAVPEPEPDATAGAGVAGSVRATPQWVRALRQDPAYEAQPTTLSTLEAEHEIRRSWGQIGLNFVTENGKVRLESFVRLEDDVSFTVFECSNFTQGPPGCVNGGCLFAVVDQAVGSALWAVHGLPGFTKSMVIRYRKFTPIANRYYLVETRLTSREGRHARLDAVVRNPATGIVHCTATLTFAQNPDGTRPRSAL